MLEASMFVDVNCVQFDAFEADVLITLERSIILFLATLPLLVPLDGDVTEYWLALIRDIV